MNNVTLYKLDSKGKIREWNICVNKYSTNADLVIQAGLQNGKMIKTSTIYDHGKNIGKVNETTAYRQAVLEAQSLIRDQIAKGYSEDINNLKKQGELGSGVPQPMLAHKYDPSMKQSGSKDLVKLKLLNKEVYVSDKLDGNRCLAHLTPEGVKLYTRKGKPFLDIEHIQKDLFNTYKNAYPNGEELWLDGELFTLKYSFNTINGVLKKAKKTQEDLDIVSSVKYHLYDAISNRSYEDRYGIINQFKSSNIDIVKATKIIATEKSLLSHLDDALQRGQEGLIIRQMNMPYENKRTVQLLKYKVFEDGEFKIIGFKRSITGETLGSIEFMMPNGNTFFARLKGSDEEQQMIWDNRGSYLGKSMTVEYFGLSEEAEGGKPRFPIAKGLRID